MTTQATSDTTSYTTKKKLTRKEYEYFKKIEPLFALPYAPTRNEIALSLGISRNWANTLVKSLLKAGWLEHDGTYRSLKLPAELPGMDEGR